MGEEELVQSDARDVLLSAHVEVCQAGQAVLFAEESVHVVVGGVGRGIVIGMVGADVQVVERAALVEDLIDRGILLEMEGAIVQIEPFESRGDLEQWIERGQRTARG